MSTLGYLFSNFTERKPSITKRKNINLVKIFSKTHFCQKYQNICNKSRVHMKPVLSESRDAVPVEFRNCASCEALWWDILGFHSLSQMVGSVGKAFRRGFAKTRNVADILQGVSRISNTIGYNANSIILFLKTTVHLKRRCIWCNVINGILSIWSFITFWIL